MPEGDTVFVAATKLGSALAGTTIVKSDFRVPRLATVDLAGTSVADVDAYGKHLFFRFDDGSTLHTHYKMDGSWHLYRAGETWRGPVFEVRAVLFTESWVAVGFRLPVVELIDRSRAADVVARLGPDPLREDWDPERVVDAISEHPDAEIGTILLDQSVVAGPGNVYKCETCYLAGLHPWSRVRDIGDVRKVVDLLARLMQANRSTGTQVTTGDVRPGRQQWVYGRSGQPCFRCGTTVRRARQSGFGGDRVTYWCPTCQPSSSPRVTAERGASDGTV